MSSDDLFDDILNLEEQYYKEGYDEGFKDGTEAGLIEGRSVGMKKGFEKFLEAGRLQGRAIVWANRIPNLRKQSEANSNSQQQQQESPQEPSSSSQDEKKSELELELELQTLPPLNSNARLEKNVTMLYGLVEPGTLSTKNDDESVNDFDSRMKAAQGRLKMIEKAVGEGGSKGSSDRLRPAQSAPKNENIEDIGMISGRTGGGPEGQS
ncbi:DUF1715-domain-containing protein [Jackrogersella minutella]|nr:DUF1715-domain-containing protein [Jackrogersella minutella]